MPGANGGSSNVTQGGLQRLLGMLVSKADSRNLQLKKHLQMILMPSGLTSTSIVLRPAVPTSPGQPGGATPSQTTVPCKWYFTMMEIQPAVFEEVNILDFTCVRVWIQILVVTSLPCQDTQIF